MFYYSIIMWEGNVTLMHTKEFSEEEFNSMCEEAPIGEFDERDSDEIEKILIDKYGFERPKFVAGFFTPW